MDNGESGEIHQFAGLSRDHIEERLGASNHFRSRVAEMCKAEVTTEDAVKGDKAVEAHREHSDATARNHWNKRRLASLAMVGGTCRQNTIQVSERSRRENTI